MNKDAGSSYKNAFNIHSVREDQLISLLNEQVTDVIWVYSLPEKSFRFISDSVFHLRGYTAEEAMQQDFHQALHEEDFNYIMNHLQARISHYQSGDESMKSLTGEFRQPHKNGKMVWVEITTVLIKNEMGIVDTILGITRDIAHRRNDHKLLHDTRNLFETVFNFTATGIALLNEERNFINVNQGFCNMLGYPRSYVMEKNFNHFIVLGDLPCIDEVFEMTMMEKNLEKQSEIRMMNLHGQVIWGLFNITGIVSSQDEKVQWVIQIQETTARKKADEIIRLLNGDLQRKNREMEQLVYVTSHDLRSPLVNLRGFSGELQHSFRQIQKLVSAMNVDASHREHFKTISGEIDESFDYINISVRKMDRLLKGLLDFSRLGKKIRMPRQINMDNLISDVIKTSEYQIKNSGIEIEVSPLPSCWASEEMINQVFSNLLGNAIKYLDPSRRGNIRIWGWQENGFSAYAVQDNGIGISPEHQQKIFELFYRLHPEMGEGEGLGLSTVKKILELSDGRISVDSTPGSGSRFIVFIPCERKLLPK